MGHRLEKLRNELGNNSSATERLIAFGSSGWTRGEVATSKPHRPLNVPELLLRHAEIVPQFMNESLADLVADFCLARTDRFDVLLVKHDVSGTDR